MLISHVELHFGGFGRHRKGIPHPILVTWFKYLYVFEFMYTLAQAANKFAMYATSIRSRVKVLCLTYPPSRILFLYRIFPVVQFRRLLLYISFIVFAFITGCIIASIFQCGPVNAFWNTLAGALPGGHCIHIRAYFLTAGAINTVTDFILLALVSLEWSVFARTLNS